MFLHYIFIFACTIFQISCTIFQIFCTIFHILSAQYVIFLGPGAESLSNMRSWWTFWIFQTTPGEMKLWLYNFKRVSRVQRTHRLRRDVFAHVRVSDERRLRGSGCLFGLQGGLSGSFGTGPGLIDPRTGLWPVQDTVLWWVEGGDRGRTGPLVTAELPVQILLRVSVEDRRRR